MMRAAALLLLLLAVSACTAIRREGERPVSDSLKFNEIHELPESGGVSLCLE